MKKELLTSQDIEKLLNVSHATSCRMINQIAETNPQCLVVQGRKKLIDIAQLLMVVSIPSDHIRDPFLSAVADLSQKYRDIEDRLDALETIFGAG